MLVLTLCLQLIVTKLRPGPVSLQDIPDNIAFSSISESAKQSLYHALKNVYAYTLGTEDGADHSEADTRLHALVMQLEAGLGSALRQQQQASVQIYADLPEFCSLLFVLYLKRFAIMQWL